MAIQNVNGRNVYVLSPKEPTGKTTSGRNWATLYSDLRWQVWEAQQKNEENKIKLDLMSFEKQKEYYDQQKKFLQNRIADLQDIKLKTGRGGAGDAVSQALRAAEAIAPKSLGGRGASGPTYRRTVVTGRVDKFGDPIPGEQVTETYSGQPVELPAGIKPGTAGTGPTIVQPSEEAKLLRDTLQKRALAALEAEGKGEVGGTIDEEIAKLESQLAGLSAPQLQTDTDLLNRTQRAFEQNVGVIGQGGGPFGLAPRSRRLAPRVDQPTATVATEELLTARGIESERRGQLEDARKALLLRRADLMAAAAEVDSEDFIADIDKQLADINTELAKPTVAQTLMTSPDFIPRRAGEFLLRERGRGADEQPQVALEVVPPAPVPAPAPYTYQQPDRFEEERRRNRQAEMEALGMTPEQPPVAPVALPPEPTVPPIPPAEIQPEPTAGTAQPVEVPPAEAPLQDPDPQELYIFYAPETKNAQGISELENVTEQEKIQIKDAYKNLVDKGQLFKTREEGKDWYKQTLDSIRSSGKQGKKTSKQRKDLYSFNVSSEGILLAQKPKKLERLAKTALPDDKRPQHIVIVDKLYETNSGKTNAFRLTYDEISRVFANDPKKRTEAHKYLVAKDVLEGNKREPLA